MPRNPNPLEPGLQSVLDRKRRRFAVEAQRRYVERQNQLSVPDAFAAIHRVLSDRGQLSRVKIQQLTRLRGETLDAALEHGYNNGHFEMEHRSGRPDGSGRKGMYWSIRSDKPPSVQPANASRYADEQWSDPKEQERQSFEHAIDQSPMDATTHGVYADWLDDHGEHDEAAFRRSMGDWHATKPWSYQNHNDISEEARPRFSHSISTNFAGLPQGVSREHIPPLVNGRDADFYEAPEDVPRLISLRYSWPTYRGMENAFRRSFLTNLQERRETPTQASRYADGDYQTPTTAPHVQPTSAPNVERHVENIQQAVAHPNFKHYLESYLGNLSGNEYAHTVRALGASPSQDEDPHGDIFRRLVSTTPQSVQPTTNAQGKELSPEKQMLAQLNAEHESPIGNKDPKHVRLLHLSGGTKGVFKPASGEFPLRFSISPGTHYKRESAASSVADLMGMGDLVPPTTIRNHNGEIGSVQQFEDGQIAARHRGQEYDGPQDAARAALFDYIIGNTDRHRGNWLISPQGKLRLIDNGLSFPTEKDAGDNFTNYDILKNAVDSRLPTPDVRGMQELWPQIEAELRNHELEPEAIEHTKNRFHAATSGRFPFIHQLPHPETL